MSEVILTGDYWHSDFSDVISKAPSSIAVVPIDSFCISRVMHHPPKAIVIAQTRPNQLNERLIDSLVNDLASVPVVALCGSWCEGEPRSGHPIPGLLRVYWHQWQGHFKYFVDCLAQQNISSWQLPKTSTAADRIQVTSDRGSFDGSAVIGVSSMTSENYEMIRDAMCESKVIWIDALDGTNHDAEEMAAICIVANSLTAAVEDQIKALEQNFPWARMVLVLNFPRRFEFDRATALGVSGVVSKPFQHTELRFAINRALKRQHNLASF